MNPSFQSPEATTQLKENDLLCLGTVEQSLQIEKAIQEKYDSQYHDFLFSM
jgi:hypothetical protein